MTETGFALTDAEAFDLAMIDPGDAGKGNESLTSNDIAIPYLSILQALSPQCTKGSPDYIKGAEPGFYFQNVSMRLWNPEEAPLIIVPCAFDRVVNEWIPRDAGGGLVGVHPVNTPLMNDARPNDKGIPTLPNGHNLIDTATHYVLYKNPDTGRFEPAVLSMKSTGLKKSRLWNSLLTQQTIPGTEQPAPRWLFTWNLTTALETKNSNSWYNFEIAKGPVVNKETYMAAKKMYDGWKSGSVRAAADSAPVADDEMPF